MNKKQKIIGSTYVALMLILYPIILTDKYYNVTDTKLYCFYILTALFSIIVFGLNYYNWLNDRTSKKKIITKTSLIYIGSIIVYTISNSGNLLSSLRGSEEYGVGIVFLIMLLMGALALKYAGYDEYAFIYAVIIGATATSFLGLLQFLGVDLFGLVNSVTVEDNNLFISTFGNTAIFGFFMVMCFPIAAHAYLEKSKHMRYAATVGIVATTFGIVIANTEATLVAFIVEVLLILFLYSKSKANIRTSLKMLGMIAISVLIFNLLLLLAVEERALLGLQVTFINPLMWTILLLGIIGLLIIFRDAKEDYTKIYRSIIGAFGGFICFIPVIAILYSSFFYVDLNSSISRALYLDYNWGNRRGFIWSKAIELYSKGSLKELILGRGIGSFSQNFQAVYGSESMDLFGTFFDDAHNMFLQSLFEYGILGLGLIILLCIKILSRLLKSENKFDKSRGVAFVGMMIASSCLIVQNITPAFLVLFM